MSELRFTFNTIGLFTCDNRAGVRYNPLLCGSPHWGASPCITCRKWKVIQLNKYDINIT